MLVLDEQLHDVRLDSLLSARIHIFLLARILKRRYIVVGHITRHERNVRIIRLIPIGSSILQLLRAQLLIFAVVVRAI